MKAKKITILPADIHRLETEVIDRYESDQGSALGLGKSLIALKAAYAVKKHFTTFLKTNKIRTSRAYYAMALARGTRTSMTYHDTPRQRALDSLHHIGRKAYTAMEEQNTSDILAAKKRISAWIEELLSKVELGKATKAA